MFMLDINALSDMMNAASEEGLLQKGWSDDPRIAPMAHKISLIAIGKVAMRCTAHNLLRRRIERDIMR